MTTKDDSLKNMQATLREAAVAAAEDEGVPEGEPEVTVDEMLRQIYADVDDLTAQTLTKLESEGSPVSCRMGCNACCKLLTLIGPAEGILLAQTLVAQPELLSRLLPRLQAQARALDEPGVTKKSWFARREACAFIDASGLCSVYAARPACCRTHYVVTPKEDCERPGANTASPDLTELDGVVFRFNVAYCQMAGIDPIMTTAPIAIMVLAVLRSMANQGEMPPELAVQCILASSRLPDPETWLRNHGRDLVREGDGYVTDRNGASAEEVSERISANMTRGLDVEKLGLVAITRKTSDR